jgi:hypothetical protein
VMSMTTSAPMERAASPASSPRAEWSSTAEGEPGMHVRHVWHGWMGWERRERSMMRRRSGRGRSMMGRRAGREPSMRRRWRWRVVWPSSRNVFATITLLWGSHLGERADDVPDSLSNLSGRMSLCVSRTGCGSIDLGLNVGSRTTNFVRSAVELITVRSPVVTASDVLHDAPQRGGELGVLREHGADHAEESSDIAGKTWGGLSGGVELRKRRVWGIAVGSGVGRWNFLDIDSSAGGGGNAMTRNFVDVNRGFLWGVVGEDGIGGRGRIGFATFALTHQRRRGGPGAGRWSIPNHARAETRVSARLSKLELVPRSGTNLAAVEGIEAGDPLPIVLYDVLVERDGPESVVGWSVAEPVSD